MPSLLIHVNLLHPVWHGSGDWPPSPFRLFQAMVAGAFGGRWASEDPNAQEQRSNAFEWLEVQPPPDIVVPPKSECTSIVSFVLNNDRDWAGMDPERLKKIRPEKVISPVRLEKSQTFLYAWHFDTGETEAKLLCDLAERLHTFGRGVDPAWARAEVIDREAAEAFLAAHGAVARPTGPVGGNVLPCPAEGSLQGLLLRHRAITARLGRDRTSKKILFRQPPKAHYRQVGYDRRPTRFLFEIRRADDLGRFVPILQEKASSLTEAIRDRAAKRLSSAAERYASLVERFIIGRGAGSGDRDRRIRIIPLPTVGHPDASPSIRRVAVEVPPECPLSAEDVRWALLGLQVSNETSSQAISASTAVLVPAQSDEVLRHYGWDEAFTRWRSVTPVVLPMAPGRIRSGSERSLSDAQCTGALVNALRHADIATPVANIRVQREPFHARGAMADAFDSSRFGGRLRHVEVVFDSPVRGPLVLGDGRFVGLGVMRKADEVSQGLHIFAVEVGSSPAVSRSTAVASAFRRAVMARAQAVFDGRPLPLLFHGHGKDGAPNRSGRHKHLFFAAFSSDGGERIDRLAVMAPGLCDRTITDRNHWSQLTEAVEGLRVLRCGRDGVLKLSTLSPHADDPFFGLGQVWTTASAYRPTRHSRRGDSPSFLIERDIRTECARRGLPAPESIQFLSMSEGPQGGLGAQVSIRFANPICGPVLLGHGCHLGAGFFRLA